MSNCVGCIPGPSCGACDCGGNGGHGYKPTDYTTAIAAKDACRFPPPEPVALLGWWQEWWRGDNNKTVRVNNRETGTVVGLREREMMLEVSVEAGTFMFPMRTTEVVA